MKFLSLQPFVPSGSNFEASKQLFQELGFTIRWDGGNYVGFENNDCRFILQKFDNKEFAENFMVTVGVAMRTNLERKYWRNNYRKNLVSVSAMFPTCLMEGN